MLGAGFTLFFILSSVAGVAFWGDSWQNTFCNIDVLGMPLIKCDSLKDTLHIVPGNLITISTDNTTDTMTIDTLATNGTLVNSRVCTGTDKIYAFNSTTGNFECGIDIFGSGGDGNTAQLVNAGGESIIKQRNNATEWSTKGFTTVRGLTITSNANDLQFDTNFKVNDITCGVGSHVFSYTNATGSISFTCTPDVTGIVSINSDITPAQVFTGTLQNVTITDVGAGALNWNLGDAVVMINGATQTITKTLIANALQLGGTLDANLNSIINFSFLTSSSSNPADSGVIRLGNSDDLCWESSPAGSDNCIFVDSGENLQFGVALANIQFNNNPLFGMTLGASENANSQKITNLGTPTLVTDAQRVNRFGLDPLSTSVCADQNVRKYQSSNGTWVCGTVVTDDTNTAQATSAGGTSIVKSNLNATNLSLKGFTTTRGLTITSNANDLQFDTSFKINSKTCPASSFVSAITNVTGSDSITCSSVSGVPVSLSGNLTTSSTAAFTTIFTIPLTANTGNSVSGVLVAESNTAGGAVQAGSSISTAAATGYCHFTTPLTASTEELDYLLLSTTTAETATTTWLPAANVPIMIVFSCDAKTGASPPNLIISFQAEVASTVGIKAGSYYIKTP